MRHSTKKRLLEKLTLGPQAKSLVFTGKFGRALMRIPEKFHWLGELNCQEKENGGQALSSLAHFLY